MFHGRKLLSQCFKELHRLARDASIRRQGSVNPGKARSFRSISVSRDEEGRPVGGLPVFGRVVPEKAAVLQSVSSRQPLKCVHLSRGNS